MSTDRATEESTPDRVDVCLSFAGADRRYVHAVATELKALGVSVFYDLDRDTEIELWGKNLTQHLDTTFRHRAMCCVVFVSAAYARARWPNHELRSALARAFEQDREYVLPARFDDTEIPGILPTSGHIDLTRRTPEQFARLIAVKVIQLKLAERDPETVSPDPPPTPQEPARRTSRTVAAATVLAVAAMALSWPTGSHTTPLDSYIEKSELGSATPLDPDSTTDAPGGEPPAQDDDPSGEWVTEPDLDRSPRADVGCENSPTRCPSTTTPPSSTTSSPSRSVTPSIPDGPPAPGIGVGRAAISATPQIPDGCSATYRVHIDILDPPADGLRHWLVSVLAMKPGWSDEPNVLHYPITRLDSTRGPIHIDHAVNTAPGRRRGSYEVVVADHAADLELQQSRDSHNAGDGLYSNTRRTKLPVGSDEVAQTPWLIQQC